MPVEPRSFTTTAPHDACRYAVCSDALTVYVRVSADGHRFEIQDTDHSVVPILTADYPLAVKHAHALWEAMHAERRLARRKANNTRSTK